MSPLSYLYQWASLAALLIAAGVALWRGGWPERLGGVAMILAWFAVLFTGRYPKDLFELVVSYKRWEMRVRAYVLFLTDQYPPFSGKE